MCFSQVLGASMGHQKEQENILAVFITRFQISALMTGVIDSYIDIITA